MKTIYIKGVESLKRCDFAVCESKIENLPDIFWERLFSKEQLTELWVFANDMDAFSEAPDELKQSSTEFIKIVTDSLHTIQSLGVENNKLFKAVNVLSYVLSSYSEFYYNSLHFDIDNAFDINPEYIQQLTGIIDNEEINPYYSFFKEFFVPEIIKTKPDIAFIEGRPGLFNFTQLSLLKKHVPDCIIYLSKHSSEYYSLNKITHLIKNNDILFNLIDGIVLDDFKHTENNLINAIQNNADLKLVPNLIYKEGQEIVQTNYQKRTRRINDIHMSLAAIQNLQTKKISSKDEIFECKLLLNQKCNWSNCSYCGINHKYPTITNVQESISEYIDFFDSVLNTGYKLLVLQDEAISKQLAIDIAKAKIERGNNLSWHIRARIEEYNPDEIQLLKKAGLSGIYFGLESINLRVLTLMNKYDKYITKEQVEKLTDMLFENNIHCHYCVIIGFPGETRAEIAETLNFITELKSKHKHLTFTVNIFELDITSKVYKNADEFGIKVPVLNHHFIENNIQYEREIPYDDLLNIKLNFLSKTIQDNTEENLVTEVLENPNSLINYYNSML